MTIYTVGKQPLVFAVCGSIIEAASVHRAYLANGLIEARVAIYEWPGFDPAKGPDNDRTTAKKIEKDQWPAAIELPTLPAPRFIITKTGTGIEKIIAHYAARLEEYDRRTASAESPSMESLLESIRTIGHDLVEANQKVMELMQENAELKHQLATAPKQAELPLTGTEVQTRQVVQDLHAQVLGLRRDVALMQLKQVGAVPFQGGVTSLYELLQGAVNTAMKEGQ